MGLFSFIKNIGAKLFHKDPPKPTTPDVTPEMIQAQRDQQKALQLKSVVTGLGLEIQNFDVTVDDDSVVVYGLVENNATREKVILALGNVEGIASVDDRISVSNPEPDSQFHTVEKGESLSLIAKQYYGDMMKYPIIFEANKPMLTSVDLIYPGQVLRIPPIA
jgi:nucleoid-associated protein YgaU